MKRIRRFGGLPSEHISMCRSIRRDDDESVSFYRIDSLPEELPLGRGKFDASINRFAFVFPVFPSHSSVLLPLGFRPPLPDE